MFSIISLINYGVKLKIGKCLHFDLLLLPNL